MEDREKEETSSSRRRRRCASAQDVLVPLLFP